MSSIYHCSPTNSTFFTTCCQVAITDRERFCPRCKEDVYPFYKGMDDAESRNLSEHRISMARWNRAFKK